MPLSAIVMVRIGLRAVGGCEAPHAHRFHRFRAAQTWKRTLAQENARICLRHHPSCHSESG